MGIERYRTVEVYFVEFRYVFNHDCLPGGLSDQPVDFCRQVANRVEKLQRFAEHHDVILFVAGNKSSNGKVLHHRAGGVDDVDVVVLGEAIGGRWFAMCTQQPQP